MGNRQTRKRHADEEIDLGQRKKARLNDGNSPGPSSGTRKRKLKNEWNNSIHTTGIKPKRRFSNFLLSSNGKNGTLFRSELRRKESMRDRCRSLDGIQTDHESSKGITSVSSFQSYASLQRKEFPVPWLEALFLPEFPSRSSITENSFLISNEIGYGSFGRVYRAIAKNNVRGIYALKVQQKSLILGKDAVQQVRREVAVQRILPPHVFIVRLYAAWQTRSKLFTVLQYPIGGIGDMFGLWREHGTLPRRAIQIYGAELGMALEFLHDNNVIYRDLKLENIVLDSLGHVRVVDFGLSKVLKNGEYTSTICGTLQYMSPEVASEKPYSHEVDWWSLAVVLHILATGRYPYPNANATHHRHLRFVDYSTPLECSSELGNLFDQMLAPPLSKRLCAFDTLKEHVFFKSINFDDILALRYSPLEEILKNEESSRIPDIIDWDSEESLETFSEDYEFSSFGYFNDEV